MSTLENHPEGHFCWSELATRDWQNAKHFYTELFQWGAVDEALGDGMYYTMLQQQGLDIAAMYQMEEERLKNKMPSHWLNYIAVDDVDSTVVKAKSLGAEVIAGPHDVADAGRMAIFYEPNGAMFAVWQAKQHGGAKLRDQVGTMCWHELATNDAQKSRQFYQQLFGWHSVIEDMDGMEYTIFNKEGIQVAGMLEMTDEWDGMPAHWMTYFEVANCDESVAKVEALGGTVCVPATDIDNVGRFSVITDPQGGFFSLIETKSKS